MKFVYSPEGADPRSWDFKPEKLMNAEAEAIERLTGWTFGEFVSKLGDTSMLAIHAVLYVMLKRSTPTLKWEQVQFSLSEVDIEGDADEMAEARQALEEKAAGAGLSDIEQAQLDAIIAQGADIPKDAAPAS